MPRRRGPGLLLGEWACLAVLAQGKAHGFAIAKRLAPSGDVGRAWSLTRPITYRSLDALVARGLVEAVRVEPGTAGGDRTVLALTAAGRKAVKAWVAEPVEHLRDLRSAFLVKLLACDLLGVDPRPLLDAQIASVRPMAEALAARATAAPDDPIAAWRAESSASALRYLQDRRDRLG